MGMKFAPLEVKNTPVLHVYFYTVFTHVRKTAAQGTSFSQSQSIESSSHKTTERIIAHLFKTGLKEKEVNLR